MIKPARLIAAVSFACAAGVSTAALAQTTTPTPSAAPAAAATPAAPSDPCGSILSIVNRPTIGTGVCPVQTGHFDVETGYTNTDTTGPGGNVTGNYPQGLIRIGTADTHLDFEVGTPSFNTSNAGGDRHERLERFEHRCKIRDRLHVQMGVRRQRRLHRADG